MQKNRKKVLKAIDSIREEAREFFIPLGSYDDSSDPKREISNLTTTLSNHIPLVKAFVKAAENHPVYVGYDGRDILNRSGTYMPNIVLLHQEADESSLHFILAYVHELTHMDQDRRSLLKFNDPPPSPDRFLGFFVQNLCLEAAALATEVTGLYYFSHCSTLAETEPEVNEYFNEYAFSVKGREKLFGHVMEALDGREVKTFDDMKPVWRAVFQAFFEPDSGFLENYMNDFCNKYTHRLEETLKNNEPLSEKEWGTIKDIGAIATLPEWGALFGPDALDILDKTIRAAVLQDKYKGMIALTKTQGQRIMNNNIASLLLSMK